MTTTQNFYDSHGNLTHKLNYDSELRRYDVIVDGILVGWYSEKNDETISMRRGRLGSGNLIGLLLTEHY